jgi:competence protein ComEC
MATRMSRLRPEVVVVSAGAGNSYGHPHLEALRLYEAVGAEVYRTDVLGNITIGASPDGTYRVEGNRAGASPPAPTPFQAPSQGRAASEGAVTIECVFYNPAGEDAGNEAVTLRVNQTVDVNGWVLVDEANDRFTLSATLQAGRTYTVTNRGAPLWNNSGDTAFLYDASGGLMDSFSYGGGGEQDCSMQ